MFHLKEKLPAGRLKKPFVTLLTLLKIKGMLFYFVLYKDMEAL